MLDPRLLRAFITVVDAGSFTLAAERLNSTQSTVSQQLARLEEATGAVLIERSARPVLPTAVGERLLGYARRLLALQQEAQAALGDTAGVASIRIGVPEDIMNPAMASVFAGFAARHRGIRLDVVSGLSRELSRRYRAGDFDIAVVKDYEPGADCRASFREPMAWYESADAPDWPNPIPLVTFPPGGLYRDVMFERIEHEQRRWYVAFSGSSLSNVLTAVEAGLGVSLLPVGTARQHRLRLHEALGTEAAIAVSLYSWEGDGPASELVGLMQGVLAARFG
ncbi:LysR family transcriptional regulator [Brevundimonas faecalis]|uniref:LysR family transcriptional regulator n=1 Tax=Brevundimonas faecalis TaxID=947378 RepID=UPI00360C471E